jgi:LytS/YehU family sensor histidine kinase
LTSKETNRNGLNFLKQQVNPHFLFNALNSTNSVTINTSDIASNTILKLSAILRYMLYETENKMVNLSDEIGIIDNYIDLQKLRLPRNVSVNYHVSGDTHNNQIAPLLLIPLIENAFKYGVDNVNDTFIDIIISIFDDTLTLEVKNRIIPKSNEPFSDSGIGIKNIKRRLDLIYPDRYRFETDQKDDIFTVNLEIKLKE